MSTINKKPYIKSLLESMSSDDLLMLQQLIDGGGEQIAIKRTMNLPSGDKTKISESDKGVHLCSLEMEYSLFIGYLVYNDDYCCLIRFADSPVLKLFEINVSENHIKTIDEELTVVELRSELYGILGGSGEGGGELKTISLEMGYSDFTPVTSKVFNITNQSLIPLIDEVFNTKAALSYKISGENENSVYATQECVCLYVEDIDGEHFEIYDRDYQTKTLKRCFGVSRTGDRYLLTLEDLSNCPVGEIVNYCMNNNLKMKFEFTLPISLGSGSGGGSDSSVGGSGKLYQYDFNLLTYDEQGNQLINDAKPFRLCIYESNFEKCKQEMNLIFANNNIPLSVTTPESLKGLINTVFDETIASSNSGRNMFLFSQIINLADGAFGMFTTTLQNLSYYFRIVVPNGIEVRYVGYNAAYLSLVDVEDNAYGLNVNNSCTLTEYGTSASGGTVEAEPIVSIKMTNLDMKTTDSDPSDIRDAQIYCTKETWNSLVDLANTLGITLTYQNLGTVLQSLSAQEQGAFIGILLNDYYNGKVLPIPYIRNSNNWCTNLVSAIQANLQSVLGANIDAVASGSWGSDELAHLFPNILDRVTDGYVTANTVITVEEIDGPAIGSSSGSGTSDVLYKHSIVVYLQGDTQEEEPSQVQFNFLSKYAEPFVTNGSLADFVTAFAAKNDFQSVIQPTLNEINGTAGFYVSNIVIDDTKITLLSAVNNNINYTFGFKFVDNTSGITDTVTPYVQVSGGSGSGSSESNANLFHINYEVQSNDGAFLVDKIYACSKQTYYSIANSAFQNIASQLGITLPTIADASSFNSAVATLVPYLNSVQQLRYAVIANLLNIEDICLKASYRQNISSTNTKATLMQFDRDDYGINVYYFTTSGSLQEVSNDTIVANIVSNGNIVGMQILELNN